jgi:hypothetical protein
MLAIVLSATGPDAAAQLFSIEQTVSTEVTHNESTDNADGDLRVPDPEVQSAGFDATEPEKLFAENVVFVEPEQKPVITEPNSVLPPDFSIPPMEEYPLELPATPQLFESPPANPPGCADESIHDFKVPEVDCERLRFSRLMHEPYSVYRTYQSTLAWLPGDGEHFGWLDWQTEPYLDRGNKHGLTGAINVHWLDGPVSSPLPSRVYDFSLGYQVRNKVSDQFSYDLYTSVGAFADFETSAREGVRFPSHAVGMFHVNHSADFIFGVDYLGRDDIAVLPVIGVSLRDVFVRGLRMDLVFPRPRIDYLLNDQYRLYLAGQMNGGTWQIEFPDRTGHIMTYRDYRLLFGVESTDKDGSLSAWEFGYVFGRNLEFRDQPGHTQFDDAFVIQWVSRR